MNVRGADFIMYRVTELERSIAFYRDTLGLELEFQYEDYWAEFTVPPTTLALGALENRPYEVPDAVVQPFRPGGGSIFLAVDDVEEAVAEMTAKGVEVGTPPSESPVCHFASIVDPDGNIILLHHRKDGSFG